MTPKELDALATQIADEMAVSVRALIDRRLDARLKIERRFTRELLRAELARGKPPAAAKLRSVK